MDYQYIPGKIMYMNINSIYVLLDFIRSYLTLKIILNKPHIDTLNGLKLMPSSKTWHGVLISGILKLNIAFSQRQIQKGPPLGFVCPEMRMGCRGPP